MTDDVKRVGADPAYSQRLFFRTPLVYAFVFGSFFYHDYLWWPLKGKRIQKEKVGGTKWGALFESY